MRSNQKDSHSEAKRPSGASDPLRKFLAKHELGGLVYHCRLAKFMTAAGFDIRRIERDDNHANVWRIQMRRAFVPRGEEVATARLYVQSFLRRQGVRCPKGEIDVMVLGDRVQVSFIWKSGAPGMVIFWGGNLRVSCQGKR